MYINLSWRLTEVKKVELFEFIRRDYFLSGKSKSEISREYGIHRRTVRQALDNPIPPTRQASSRSPVVLTAEFKHLIDDWLKADFKAPKKQRHTGLRVFNRLKDEHGFTGAYPTIRKYVGMRKKELSISLNAFVPQTRYPGEEAEVDWYEAHIDFPTGRRKVYLFQMRACYSGREFHMAFFNQTQQAFIEAHVMAFIYFDGVFKKIRYDNLKSAVKKVLQGRKREETDRFIALRSHYLFESVFCIPGIQGAHEKGGVEGGVGRFRRHHLSPVPRFDNIIALNEFVLSSCKSDDSRTIEGKKQTISAHWSIESQQMTPLPKQVFDIEEVATPQVNKKSLFSFRSNQYSIPVHYVGRKIEVRATSSQLICYVAGKQVATHHRLHGVGQISAKLDHYLELLYRKPGALAGSVPLSQLREKGTWPNVYDLFWQHLKQRYGDSKGTKQFIEILLLLREWPDDSVQVAIQCAIESGCSDSGAVMMLLRYFNSEDKPVEILDEKEIHNLVQYNRALPNINEYNLLLSTISEKRQ